MKFLILIIFASIVAANHELYNTLPLDLRNILPSKQATYPSYQPLSKQQFIYPRYQTYVPSVPMTPRPIYPSNKFGLYEPSFNTPPPQPTKNQIMNQFFQKRMIKKFSDNILEQSDADLQKKYLKQLVWMMRSGMFKSNNGLSNMFPMMQMDLFGEDNDITGLLPLMQMGLLGQQYPMENLPSEHHSYPGNYYNAPVQPPQNQLINQFLQQRMISKFSDNILSQSDADLKKKHLNQLIWMMRSGMFKSNNGLNTMLPMMQMDLFGEDSEMSDLLPLMQMGLFGRGQGMNLFGIP